MSLMVNRIFAQKSFKLLRGVKLREVRWCQGSTRCPQETCSSAPPPVADSCCPQPPPCPEPPPCPPRLCPEYIDPGNPCNYCPPPCRDGPDLTRLKKYQCIFQEDNGLPIYLKLGKRDVIVYRGILVLTVVNLIWNMYLLIFIIP